MGLEANVLDCDIVEREFELRLGYYSHFQTKTLGKYEIVPLLF